MGALTGSSIASTYKQLLKITSEDMSTTPKYIEDGEGTDSILSIGTNDVGIGTVSFQVASVNYLGIKNGTSPGALTADQIYVGARDSAGTGTDTLSTLALFLEEAKDMTALDAVGTLTTRFPIWINDECFWLYLDPV